mmetsp:Transcript_119145/g.333789  ORF Transcript_119145/g.333789 Transcript_119145/m.333789 type:complete len:320 (-) Transcript_119145:280-1239(-)
MARGRCRNGRRLHLQAFPVADTVPQAPPLERPPLIRTELADVQVNLRSILELRSMHLLLGVAGPSDLHTAVVIVGLVADVSEKAPIHELPNTGGLHPVELARRHHHVGAVEDARQALHVQAEVRVPAPPESRWENLEGQRVGRPADLESQLLRYETEPFKRRGFRTQAARRVPQGAVPNHLPPNRVGRRAVTGADLELRAEGGDEPGDAQAEAAEAVPHRAVAELPELVRVGAIVHRHLRVDALVQPDVQQEALDRDVPHLCVGLARVARVARLGQRAGPLDDVGGAPVEVVGPMNIHAHPAEHVLQHAALGQIPPLVL